MSNAENIFEEFIRDGWSAVERLYTIRQAETLFLDFKTSKYDGSSKNITTNDLKNLSKSISGFGNSEGGVVVWGVSSSGKEGDFADHVHPIPNINNFAALIDGAVAGRTIPPHENIQTYVIWCDSSGAGVAATLVPKGRYRPYQSVPEYKYFLRAGNSFQPVPHDILRSLFLKDPRTQVEPKIQYRSHMVIFEDRSVGIGFRFLLQNAGSAIAEDLFCSLNIQDDQKNLSRVQVSTKGVSASDRWIVEKELYSHFHAISDKSYRLPPGSFVTVMAFEFFFQGIIKNTISMKINGGASNAPSSELTVRVKPKALNPEIEKLQNNDEVEPAPNSNSVSDCSVSNGVKVNFYKIFEEVEK